MRALRALARHELRLFASLALWAARRTHGAAGGRVFGYARGQGPVTAGLAFVCLVETLTMSVLLRDLPGPHTVMLLLDAYAVVLVVALHAARTVRPHVLTAHALRIRHSAHVDLWVPFGSIASVRRRSGTAHTRADGELDLPVGSHTSVVLELTAPLVHVGLLGRCREVRVVRFHAEDADGLVRALSTLARNADEGETPCLCCCPRPKARPPRAVAPR